MSIDYNAYVSYPLNPLPESVDLIRQLDADDIRNAISMRKAIDVVKDAFRELSSGEARVPLRSHISTSDGDTFFMPAWLSRKSAMGVKVVSVRQNNQPIGLPTVPAVVVLIDVETGTPQALVDGTYLTLLRTGAAVGAATELLSRSNAATLAMIGAGALSPFCIEAVCAVRQIEEVRIVSRTTESATRLHNWCAEQFSRVHARVCKNSHEAVSGCDVIVCATTSASPVLSGDDLKPGAHVNGVGSFRKDMQEIDEITIQRARVIVDSIEACLNEAGDIAIPIARGRIAQDHIQAELGEVLAAAKPGRVSDSDITIFKSVGNAAQDIAVAHAVAREFLERKD